LRNQRLLVPHSRSLGHHRQLPRLHVHAARRHLGHGNDRASKKLVTGSTGTPAGVNVSAQHSLSVDPDLCIRSRASARLRTSQRSTTKRHFNYNGNFNRASAPRSSFRFSSVKVPPCPSAICRLNASPIPVPPFFVVKNGTNTFAGF